jgi:rhodanese-related sulfurtransferase
LDFGPDFGSGAGAQEMSTLLDPDDVKDVEPAEAWSALNNDPSAVLVDVRTRAEWTFVGLPLLDQAGKKPLLVEWQMFPGMALNSGFVAHLEEQLAKSGRDKDSTLFFLCRSGARSKAAAQAMKSAGWTNSNNIAGGFEGNPDTTGHRGHVNGWKAAQLPWAQS